MCLCPNIFSVPFIHFLNIFMMYIQVGDSALMVAARWGMTGVVKELVEGVADLNLQDNVCQ